MLLINKKGQLISVSDGDLAFMVNKIMECEREQNPDIQHEFAFPNEADADYFYEHLSGIGYPPLKRRVPVAGSIIYYVSVSYHHLKRK